MSDAAASDAAPVRLDLWADIACPWCYLGSARLSEVVDAATARGEVVHVRHRPFQLDPALPPEGRPFATYLEEKLGPAAADQIHERLVGLGAEVGIRFDFDAVAVAPNTRLAHHLLSTYDGDPRQRAAVRALYAAHFERGLDVTRREVLADVVAEAIGEPREDVLDRLDRPADVLDHQLRLGLSLGVSAVPTFVADAGAPIDPAVELSAAAVAAQGAQPAEILERLLGETRTRAAAS